MTPNQAIQAFCLSEPLCILPLKGGANNRVYKLEFSNEAPLVLKQYFQHPQDPRPRLSTEFSFLQYAWKTGLRNIPEPLQISPETHSALYSFLPGRPMQPADVTNDMVAQMVSFFLALNRHKAKADTLPNASEACFSLSDYLDLTQKRIDRLKNAQTKSLLETELRTFIHNSLIPKWNRIKAVKGKAALPLLGRESQCVTPSDFGFHNTLIDEAGTLSFIDFEYAGWDDPCKTVCDLFCQPRVPLPARYFRSIAETFAGVAAHPDDCLRRIELFWPVMQMRWCCILLNTFTHVGKDRRQFSQSEELEYQEKQLNQSKQLIDKIQI